MRPGVTLLRGADRAPGCEAFDSELAVLIEQDTEERFIWRDFADRSVNEIRLAANEYEASVRAFLEWLDPLTGHDSLRERLAGKIFVMVGEFSQPRKALEGLIHRFGGRIERKVTIRTSYVVAGSETGRQLQKVTQAGSLGIPILSERELRELLPEVSGS
jgi:NAD-dependent DNA ligase